MSIRQLSTPGDSPGGRRHDCTFLDDAGTEVTSHLIRADRNRPRRLHSEGPVTLLCISSGALPSHVTVPERRPRQVGKVRVRNGSGLLDFILIIHSISEYMFECLLCIRHSSKNWEVPCFSGLVLRGFIF